MSSRPPLVLGFLEHLNETQIQIDIYEVLLDLKSIFYLFIYSLQQSWYRFCDALLLEKKHFDNFVTVAWSCTKRASHSVSNIYWNWNGSISKSTTIAIIQIMTSVESLASWGLMVWAAPDLVGAGSALFPVNAQSDLGFSTRPCVNRSYCRAQQAIGRHWGHQDGRSEVLEGVHEVG